MKELPKVGMGVIVVKDNEVLIGKRKNSHGEGSWSLPGGHLELYEELKDCARRETLEETGVKIKNIRFAAITNDMMKDENLHYITIFMISDHDSGEAKVMEPDKCEEWRWVSWNEMPRPLFLPLKNLVEQGYRPF